MMMKIIIIIIISLGSITRADAAIIAVDRDGIAGYRTIQSAINSAEPGDTITISAGRYKESLILKSGLKLQGQGSGVTRIEDNGETPIIYAQEVTDVTLSGLSISYSGKKNLPLILLNSSNISISNTLLYGSTLSAVEAKKGSTVKIKNSLIKGNRGSGLLVSESNISIENSFIGSNGYFGIEIKNKGEASIKDSYINENQTGGILVRDGGKITLQNNLILGNILNGVWLKGASYQVSNNTLAENTESGILLQETAKGEIIDNIFYNNGTGIKAAGIKDKTDNRVSSNILWKNQKNYVGITKGNGDIISNPLFAQNYNLGENSPALKGEKRIGAIPAPLLFSKLLEEPTDNETPENEEDSYQPHYEKGLYHKKRGEYDKAIDAFIESASLKGDFSLPFYHIGKIYERTGELERAKEAYIEAIAIKEDNPDFHLSLGEVYWRLKEYSLAQEEIKKAMSINSASERGKKIMEKIESEMQENRNNKKQK